MNDKRRTRYSDQDELEELEEVAKALDLQIGKPTRRGSEANLVGMRSDHVLLSRRLDSRTYFVHDDRYGVGRERGTFAGSKRTYLSACRRIVRSLGLPLGEIGDSEVLTEQSQVAYLDPDRTTVHHERVLPGRRVVRLGRTVDGLPIWSSGAVIGLDAKGAIGYLQVHWPELPRDVLHEGHRLAYMLGNDWHVPAGPGAEIETTDAGIVHSPAIGFCMDITAAIRVVYRPKEASLGQRMVQHFDRHGKHVAIPRHAELPVEAPMERPRSGSQTSL